MNTTRVIEHIVGWLESYCKTAGTRGFVVGISGGIDSAVTSTLCAKTGHKVIVLNLPIHQFPTQIGLSEQHIAWLKAKFPNVESQTVELSPAFDVLSGQLPKTIQDQLTMANTRARLRMLTLY